MHVYVYVHISMSISMYKCIYVCVCLCMFVYACVYLYVCMYAHRHTPKVTYISTISPTFDASIYIHLSVSVACMRVKKNKIKQRREGEGNYFVH